MAEKLEVYDLEGNLVSVEDRKDYYKRIRDEFTEKGKINSQVRRVVLLLMNSKGKIVLQRRSKIKKENANLFDKTIGGHVEEDDSYEVTVIKECSEELGFPVSILDKNDFYRALKKTDLRIIGLFTEIDSGSNVLSTRVKSDGTKFVQPYMEKVYIGYFDGPIQFIDGESSGIQLYTVDELQEEISSNNHKFTEDLKTMFEKYREHLRPIQ